MFPPNIDPQVFSISASLVGAVLAPELTPRENASVGFWLTLVGNYLLAYSSQALLIENRNLYHQECQKNLNDQAQMDIIIKSLHKMECEIEKIKRDYSSNSSKK